MSDRSTDTKDTQPVATQNGEINPSRRKLTGAALGVSAIFTLASRPVLAGQCMTPSSAASGNLSTHGTPTPCTGKTPAQWAVISKSSYPGGNPKFKDVFANGIRATWDSDDKLDGVLTDTTNSTNSGPKPNPISKEFAAARLNIRGGFVPASVLTEMQLIGMWYEWVTTGIFTPKAGASWTADQIVTYLRTLQA